MTKQGALQVSLLFSSEFNETWHNKQILGGALVSQPTDFIYRANKSCFFSSQTEEQRMTQRSQEWLHLPACSYIHQSEQKCLVKSRYAHWVLHCCQHWSIWKCYRLGDLSGGSYFCLYFLNYYSNTLMKSGTSFISCLTELNFGKYNTDLR